jgi:hypothetical protein
MFEHLPWKVYCDAPISVRVLVLSDPLVRVSARPRRKRLSSPQLSVVYMLYRRWPKPVTRQRCSALHLKRQQVREHILVSWCHRTHARSTSYQSARARRGTTTTAHSSPGSGSPTGARGRWRARCSTTRRGPARAGWLWRQRGAPGDVHSSVGVDGAAGGGAGNACGGHGGGGGGGSIILATPEGRGAGDDAGAAVVQRSAKDAVHLTKDLRLGIDHLHLEGTRRHRHLLVVDLNGLLVRRCRLTR